MRADEKKCPKCAETIKLEAAVCRFCGKEFSAREIALSKYRDGASSRDRAIDDAIAKGATDGGVRIEWLYLESPLRRMGIRGQMIANAAIRSNFSEEDIVRRLGALDLTVLGDYQPLTEEELSNQRENYRAEQAALEAHEEERRKAPLTLDYALEVIKRDHAVITDDLEKALAEQLGISRKQVSKAARQRGLGYVINDGSINWKEELSGKLDLHVPRVQQTQRRTPMSGSARDSQYGVLQPAANLAGGCVTMWQWVILLFLIALIWAAVASLFE